MYDTGCLEQPSSSGSYNVIQHYRKGLNRWIFYCDKLNKYWNHYRNSNHWHKDDTQTDQTQWIYLFADRNVYLPLLAEKMSILAFSLSILFKFQVSNELERWKWGNILWHKIIFFQHSLWWYPNVLLEQWHLLKSLSDRHHFDTNNKEEISKTFPPLRVNWDMQQKL